MTDIRIEGIFETHSLYYLSKINLQYFRARASTPTTRRRGLKREIANDRERSVLIFIATSVSRTFNDKDLTHWSSETRTGDCRGPISVTQWVSYVRAHIGKRAQICAAADLRGHVLKEIIFASRYCARRHTRARTHVCT